MLVGFYVLEPNNVPVQHRKRSRAQKKINPYNRNSDSLWFRYPVGIVSLSHHFYHMLHSLGVAECRTPKLFTSSALSANFPVYFYQLGVWMQRDWCNFKINDFTKHFDKWLFHCHCLTYTLLWWNKERPAGALAWILSNKQRTIFI